ncbi:MAG: tRNA adenosine(34) deaminase TadA [Syntrophomonadaceae bacterium]|nr:tRNA adenosine(34) deaminase TadA [Syntrophomonadaceae bacterium]HPR93948.1 tRNA adenosine(34) deaminase TadA [Syntrophomonadaceae bacterium]
MRDELYMRLALNLAYQAYLRKEVPIATIIVYEDSIIAWAYNEKEKRQDSTAHAEMLAIQRAANYLGHWRLSGATMYCTLEPCVMCAGAMINSRLERLVFASKDPKAGAAGSVIDLVRYPGLNHQVKVEYGILEEECAQLLRMFFADLRRDG